MNPLIKKKIQKAYTLLNQQDFSGAINQLKAVLKKHKLNPDAWFLLGTVYGQTGHTTQAIECLEKVVSINPDHSDGLSNLAVAYMELGNIAKAKEFSTKVLQNNNKDVAALYNLGCIYQSENNNVEAIHYFEQANIQEPDSFDILNNLGIAYKNNGNYNKATEVFELALQHSPGSAILNSNLCATYRQTGDFTAARKYCEKALSLQPDYHDALINQGNIHKDHCELDKAIQFYKKALVHKPNSVDAKWGINLAYLLAGNYADGWDDFDSRLSRTGEQHTQFPTWDGQRLEGTLLIQSEQGLGDQIMFASCIPDVLCIIEHCIIDCNPRLVELFSRSFPECTIVASNTQQDISIDSLPQMPDAHIMMGSLPVHFRKTIDAFPDRQAFLLANKQKQSAWKQKLATLGSRLKIGISWEGGTTQTRGFMRSIALEQWLPILRCDNADFISLQYTNCENELKDIKTQYGIDIHHWQEAIDDYSETAALVAELDLVISIDTAIVHLAGSLGTPTWVLVPSAPEWRYGCSGTNMPWYPSVKLYRQKHALVWDDVIKQVNNNLQSFTTRD